MYHLGIDIGSISVKVVILDEEVNIIKTYYKRHLGQPIRTLLSILKDLPVLAEYPFYLGITGGGSKTLAEIIPQASFVNELISTYYANSILYPHIRTIIEIGGEDSKLILLDWDNIIKKIILKDFATNTLCAAGTGSFLDQQATRLKLSIEEFSRLATVAKNTPRIAGRCSVFAKSDMIHLQQKATPVEEIIRGLCFALARNFKATIAHGKDFIKPISFQGGVAANKGMVVAFQQVLNLKEDELIIPPHYLVIGAIGAALFNMKENTNKEPIKLIKIISLIENYLVRKEKQPTQTLQKLTQREYIFAQSFKEYTVDKEEYIEAYLGIDIGSVSTNLALIDKDKNLLAKQYLPTAGRPIEAVKIGLKNIKEELSSSLDKIKICGVCTTGSGRYMIADFVGADYVKNEITAQAEAAIQSNPTVDTIFEIGGQDSKYISIKDGLVVDFEMNKVCAAGTGSFLEEQAERLGISIKEEFQKFAFSSNNPVKLGERCTVFMESDVVHYKLKATEVSDLAAGLAYSIAYNYLNRVVRDKKVGDNIFFQGGVAANKAVVAAFEHILGKKITVPEHHEVFGAIGCALIAQKLANLNNSKKSSFKGFSLIDKKYNLSSFVCEHCPNQCEINKINIEGEKTLYYGGRCERYEKIKKEQETIEDLFSLREELLLSSYKKKNKSYKLGRLGIPRIFYFFYDFYPFWEAFFSEIGFEVVLSEKTNKKIIHAGVEHSVAETCYPVKVAIGHILDLLEKKVDYIFLPSMIDMHTEEKYKQSFFCPYTQSFTYTVKAAINFDKYSTKILQPHIWLKSSKGHLNKVLLALGAKFGIQKEKVKSAIATAEESLKNFKEAREKKGREVLANLQENGKLAVVIVSRPYNGYDSGINLNLPKIFRELGILPIPLDFLNTDNYLTDWPNMYWNCGQHILSAAALINNVKNLYPVYITNFGCGPDSFLLQFFKEECPKPLLEIEIDEHSADTGAITRCEAFHDSLINIKHLEEKRIKKKIEAFSIEKAKTKLLFIPYMCDHAYALAAAFRANQVEAYVMPPQDDTTVELGRKYTIGKECYPCILTTGDMVKVLKESQISPDKIAFFMGGSSGPCRFGQYSMLHRLILDDLGYEDVPIFAPNQAKNFYKELKLVGKDFTKLAWKGIVAVDVLQKVQRAIRPYEKKRGSTDTIYKKYLNRICSAIENRESLTKVLEEAKKDFSCIEKKDAPRIKVGVVGEIFIRANNFSNNYLIEELEALGAEVLQPTIGEWFLYRNWRRNMHNLLEKDYISYLKEYITDFFQRKIEKRYSDIFYPLVGDIMHEVAIIELLRMSQKYLHWSFEGEAILSIGKAIDFIKHAKICGIINVMPFTCMPGNITSSLLKLVYTDYNIPYINIAYDGTKELNIKTRLEAFIYQARLYNEII